MEIQCIAIAISPELVPAMLSHWLVITVLLGTFLHDHLFILTSTHSLSRSKFLTVYDGLRAATIRSHLTCAFNALVQ